MLPLQRNNIFAGSVFARVLEDVQAEQAAGNAALCLSGASREPCSIAADGPIIDVLLVVGNSNLLIIFLPSRALVVSAPLTLLIIKQVQLHKCAFDSVFHGVRKVHSHFVTRIGIVEDFAARSVPWGVCG